MSVLLRHEGLVEMKLIKWLSWKLSGESFISLFISLIRKRMPKDLNVWRTSWPRLGEYMYLAAIN